VDNKGLSSLLWKRTKKLIKLSIIVLGEKKTLKAIDTFINDCYEVMLFFFPLPRLVGFNNLSFASFWVRLNEKNYVGSLK